VKYLWGGYTDPIQGLDCSGLGHYALTKALEDTGYKVGRLPARDIFHGRGGWIGNSYFELRDRQHLDAAFLTSGRKPWERDHMGFLIESEDGSFDVIEASGSAGTVVRRAWDLTPFAKWSDGFRHLTIGE
jgi:hypothetical protein